MTDSDLGGLVERALAEDVGSGDVTTDATVAEEAHARARIVQKAPGAIYGLDAAEAVFTQLDPGCALRAPGRGGRVAREGGPVLTVEGSARALLTGERTALNFLAHLSGVATISARAARAVQGTGARVLDTRKTTPGLRALEKAAVAAGGASNHRAGLYDAVLIKENHIAAAGGIAAGGRRARARRRRSWRGRSRSRCATRGDRRGARRRAPRLLLDNMDDEQLRAAVAQVAGRAELEASGGVTLETLRARAETGVEWVSMGALTHSAPALDLSLILEVLP